MRKNWRKFEDGRKIGEIEFQVSSSFFLLNKKAHVT
jgi:hypothetical protein